ncbi:MAG: ATP-binding protein [Oscillospiraceae bacterium]|jgi:anti-sigma regulatory factor (Ser/Thr protein kinase)|nr:ATP-binding protein [Oscillospiraceae bacterium]
MNEIIVAASLNNADKVLDFIEQAATGLGFKEQTQLRIAAEEVFVNIASYAYSPSSGDVRIRVSSDAEAVTVEFADKGKPYNPLEHSDPDISLPLQEREIGGLGLLMAKKLTDHIEYQRSGELNILTIRKNCKH